MLKAALRLQHVQPVPNNSIANNVKYSSMALSGAIIDNQTITDATFTHFVFSDCGMRGVTFDHCKFVDCIFAGCYLKDAVFKDCLIRGCHFEICTTTGVKINQTTIEHVDFFRCVLPFREFARNLGPKHASNDKMMLNCAAEAHRTGRWREAEQFLERHLVEKRRFWRKMIFSKDPFYSKYSVTQKARALLRLSFSYLTRLAFGDRTSIIRFLSIGALLCFVVGPHAAFFLDTNPAIPETIPDQVWLSRLLFFVRNYDSYFLEFVNLLIGSNLKSQYKVNVSAPELFEIVSRVTGIVYLAVLGNLATKSLGNGPNW